MRRDIFYAIIMPILGGPLIVLLSLLLKYDNVEEISITYGKLYLYITIVIIASYIFEFIPYFFIHWKITWQSFKYMI